MISESKMCECHFIALNSNKRASFEILKFGMELLNLNFN